MSTYNLMQQSESSLLDVSFFSLFSLVTPPFEHQVEDPFRYTWC